MDNYRKATPAEALAVLLSIHGDSFSPAEVREVREAIYALTPPAVDRAITFAALIELGHRIEACGASPELTRAVSLCSDLRAAIGNQHNMADRHAAERVLSALQSKDSSNG